MTLHTSIFASGPFLEAQEDAEAFAMNIYFYHCLEDSVEAHAKAQEEYKLAVVAQDEKMMAQKKGEIAYYENILLLAAKMLKGQHETTQ